MPARRRAARVAVVCDLDGTLVDLDVDIAAVRAELTALFAPCGYRGGFRPILPGIAAAARAASSAGEDEQTWLRRGRSLLDQAELAGPMTPRPGAAALLARLRAAAMGVAIVTDNGRQCARRAVQLLAGDVQLIVSRDEVACGKPDPEGVVAAARALLPDGGRLWLVGDSGRDMEAATRAASQLATVIVQPIGVCGGRSTAAELTAAGAETVVADLGQFAALLASRSG